MTDQKEHIRVFDHRSHAMLWAAGSGVAVVAAKYTKPLVSIVLYAAGFIMGLKCVLPFLNGQTKTEGTMPSAPATLGEESYGSSSDAVRNWQKIVEEKAITTDRKTAEKGIY